MFILGSELSWAGVTLVCQKEESQVSEGPGDHVNSHKVKPAGKMIIEDKKGRRHGRLEQESGWLETLVISLSLGRGI